MLSFVDKLGGGSRRDFLRIGALSLGGLSLPGWLAAKAAAAEAEALATDKSVIFLFQHGGPSQYETFDPKMTAPDGIRSATGEIKTTVPGVTFGGTMTKLAKQMHRLAIVRSFQSGSAAHRIQPIVSEDTLGANMGSLYSRVVGTSNPVSGMPTNVAIFPNAVDPKGPPEDKQFGQFSSPGMLGVGYAPFVPGAGSVMQDNMQLKLSRDRLDDRRSLLANLDRVKRQADASGMIEGMDKFQQQAFDVITGGVAEAFDLSKEDPKLIARYDTEHLFRPKKWDYKNNREHYNAHAKSLGKLLLLARRLCEAGCRFVTINTSFVWDMHADINNLPMTEGMDYVARPHDHAVSAFIEDVEDRGLSEKIMLVSTGEMGRTPRINKDGGRGHWGRITPLMIYGGGIEGGQVIGESNRDGGEPASNPITSKDLLATVMANLMDLNKLRTKRGIPLELGRAIAAGTVIPGLS